MASPRPFVWLLLLLLTPPIAAAAIPTITQLPYVNVSTLIADDTTQYTVTMTGSDASGYNDLRDYRILINYTESPAGDTSLGRGYLAWGATEGDVTRYGGNWIFADPTTGTGRWGYNADTWGGTTYITPISAAVTTTGKASGGAGTRTVAWTFSVKPAFAFNPLMNDFDGWIADYSTNVGWWDSPYSFDVVEAPCSTICATPSAPTVYGPTAKTLNIALSANDSSSDLYAIQIAPDLGGKRYVQSDGTVGIMPVWKTRTNWGYKTVKGLLWSTTYSFTVRASRSVAGYCPSGWGPAATGTTADALPVIDFRAGTAFSPWVRGQNPYRSVPAGGYATIWSVGQGASGRGLAGGLDADTYDWRNINSGSNWGLVGGKFTTLEFLQYARDNNVAPLMTANAFGGGARNETDGTFVCETVNPDGLAADWIRYINFIVPTFRQGQESSLTGEDLRVYNSISDWGGKARLLAPSEGVTPPALYWEIGNEPELGGYGTFLTNHYLGPTDYRDRYQMMATAMKAIDPAVKIGPCLMTPGDPAGSGQWLSALAADPTIPIDFIGYHPYYGSIKAAWGNAQGMTDALRAFKAYLHGKVTGMDSIMAANGRTGYRMMATEWNPLNWDAPGSMQSSMSMALAVAEGCFTFAEDDVLAAHFWEQPQSKLGAKDMFAGLRDHMGDTLVATVSDFGLSAADIDWRVYVTRNASDNGRFMIWGLNFQDDTPVDVSLALKPCRFISATQMRYGRAAADTSLTTYSGMTWTQQDVSAGFDPNHFVLSMNDAEVTILIIEVQPVPWVDYDRDGDVDQSDFGAFQACLTGPVVPQTDPACAGMLLDDDTDVDAADMALFGGCFSGSGEPADPDCLPW